MHTDDWSGFIFGGALHFGILALGWLYELFIRTKHKIAPGYIIMIEMIYVAPCYRTDNLSMFQWPRLIKLREFYSHRRRIVNI